MCFFLVMFVGGCASIVSYQDGEEASKNKNAWIPSATHHGIQYLRDNDKEMHRFMGKGKHYEHVILERHTR